MQVPYDYEQLALPESLWKPFVHNVFSAVDTPVKLSTTKRTTSPENSAIICWAKISNFANQTFPTLQPDLCAFCFCVSAISCTFGATFLLACSTFFMVQALHWDLSQSLATWNRRLLQKKVICSDFKSCRRLASTRDARGNSGCWRVCHGWTLLVLHLKSCY